VSNRSKRGIRTATTGDPWRNEMDEQQATLTDEEIETRRTGFATRAESDTGTDTGDDTGDTSDTGDDSGDVSDTSDTGDDSGDTGDDSGDAA
jgi:hypothetical protein